MQEWPERYSYAVSLLDDLTDVADWEGLLARKRHSHNIGPEARPTRLCYHTILQRCRQIFQRNPTPSPRPPAGFSRRSSDPETSNLSAESIYEEPKPEIQAQLDPIPPVTEISPNIPHYLVSRDSNYSLDISVSQRPEHVLPYSIRRQTSSLTSIPLIPLSEAQSRPEIVRRFIGY